MKEQQTHSATPASEAKAQGSAAAPTEPRAESVSLSRRVALGAGLFAGLASILSQACSGNDFASGSSNGAKKDGGKKPGAPTGNKDDAGDGSDEADGGVDASDAGDEQVFIDAAASPAGGGVDADGGLTDASADADTDGDTSTDTGSVDGANGTDGGNLDAGEDSDACYANTATQLDTSKLPAADPDQTPAVKFYGKDGSAMIAMKFPKGDGIQQVIVCKEDGKLLALHGMTGADAGGTRPIVIDNINLTGVASLKLVVQMNGGARVVATVPKAYFRDFNGAVTDLSMAPDPTKQSVAQFSEGVGTFNKDPNVVYPNDFNSSTVRNLQTCKSDTTWTAGAGVKGTVTDIMGNQITISGSTIIEHPTFCTYSGGFRTMIRIG